MRVYPIDGDTDEVEWAAEFPDLPGCVGAGDTVEEAVAMATDAKKAWLVAALEDGRSIPVPSSLYESEYSGKFTLRIPKTLHRELALQAEEEGVSLNQLILYLISKGISGGQVSAAREIDGKVIFEVERKIMSLERRTAPWREVSYPMDYLTKEFSGIVRERGGQIYGRE